MTGAAVDVGTSPDGTIVIQPHGTLGIAEAIELRGALVRAIRHDRPLRLVLELADVHDLDAINLGTLAAACHLGDDHQVVVFLDHATPRIAEDLTAAGVPTHRLRHVAATAAGGDAATAAGGDAATAAGGDGTAATAAGGDGDAATAAGGDGAGRAQSVSVL